MESELEENIIENLAATTVLKKTVDNSSPTEYKRSPTCYSDQQDPSTLKYTKNELCDPEVGSIFLQFAEDYFFLANMSQEDRGDGKGSVWSDIVQAFLNEPSSIQFLVNLTSFFQSRTKSASAETSRSANESSSDQEKSGSAGKTTDEVADQKKEDDEGEMKDEDSDIMDSQQKTHKCKAEDCRKQAYFNFPGEANGHFCSAHKIKGMRDVKNKKCHVLGCTKQPSFNFAGQRKGKYCAAHKKKDMVDVQSKRCEFPVCNKRAYFNAPGEVKARYCTDHKSDGMIGVQSQRCKARRCSKLPHFNFPGELKGLCCQLHRSEGMVDLRLVVESRRQGLLASAGVGLSRPRPQSSHTRAPGAAKVRWFARRGGARLALRHWYEYSQMALALDIAEHIWTEALIRRVFLAFRDTMRLILRDRNLEADALQRQKEIAKMLADAEEEAEEIRKAEAFIVEKKQEYDKKVKEEQKRQEEEEKEAKRKEMKEEKNSIILAIQQDERRKRVDQQIADMFQNHREKWAATEVRELAAAEARYRAWLQTPEAASAIDREFKFLRRDFYAAPTPERQEREAQLKNLANIVFCNVSHKLFQDQLTLREFYDGVDESGDGFLDYEEFAALITALDINLSADQMRTVLQTVDDDESGFINFEEFEGAMEKVQGVCGLEGSPWRLYIEPAQAVLCYHNIETGEKILDYKMKDEKLKEINLDEMTAKEKIKIRKEINERKEKDWEDIMEHWAATTLQKLWWLHKGRQARAHKKMVDETREYRQERALKKAMAIRLQSWARVVASKQRARFRLQVTVERVWDPEHGRAFYFNHALGASSWEPPPQVVKLNTTLPDPIEWYQVKDEQGVLEFKNWKTGEISSKKPLGFPMCLACASTLATRNCRTCNLGYCFKCFRLAHNHAEYEGHAWEPMRPVLCSTCNKTPTQVRCKDCEKSFCKKCFERTHEDGTPKAGHSKINI